MRVQSRLLVAALCLALLAAGCNDAGPAPESSGRSNERDGSSTDAQSGRERRAQAKDDCVRDAAEAGGTDAVRLVDRTDAARLTEPLRGMAVHAVAAGDANGDGWLDLFVGSFADRKDEHYAVRGATGPTPDRLLLGSRDGFRVDESFPAQFGRTSGATFADLDGDDDLDLVVSRNALKAGRKGNRPLQPSQILENEGGTFKPAGSIVPALNARAVAVGDFDGDRRLDLFMVADRFRTGSSVLLHNDGGMRFSDGTKAAGIPADVTGLGAVAADLDGRGRADLFVAGSNRLFVSDGERFREVKSDTFTWELFGEEDDVAGVAAADLDRDGRLDLVVGQHFNSTIDDCRDVPVKLFLNRSSGDDVRFEDATSAAQLPDFPTKAPHVDVADFDNDGWPDLLVTASADAGTRPVVLKNRGRSGTPSFGPAQGLGDPQYWVTGAVADFDRDGRLDVFVAEFEPGKPSLYFENDTSGGHWLSVVVKPARAIGTIVEVFEAGGMGDPARRLSRQQVVTTTGYAGGAPNSLHVGLGARTRVDVRVASPGAAVVERRAVATDQTITFP